MAKVVSNIYVDNKSQNEENVTGHEMNDTLLFGQTETLLPPCEIHLRYLNDALRDYCLGFFK